MRFYIPVNASPRQLVNGLGSNIPLNGSVEFKRRDGGSIELQLFTGEQGAVQPYQLPGVFEMRFALKAKGDYAGPAIVLSEAFTWLPIDQLYSATPSLNTTQLNDLFATEPVSIELMGEFTWRDLTYPEQWSSSSTFPVIVVNDVIRGDEGAPTGANAVTQYITRGEIDAGFVRANAVQALPPDGKTIARGNINAADADAVLLLTAQTLSAPQQAQVQSNLAVPSLAALAANTSALAALDAATLKLAAQTLSAPQQAQVQSNLAVPSAAALAALDAATLKITAQTLSTPQKLQVLANIGAAPAASFRARQAARWNAPGGATAPALDGALHTAIGTATARPVTLLDAGHPASFVVSTWIITSVAHGKLAGQPVQFTATGTSAALPGGLTAGTWYYLRDITADTFKISDTPGGPPRGYTSAGTGTLKAYFTSAPLARTRRIGFVSAATVGKEAGTRHTTPQWALSPDPALGGWTFAARFGISDPAPVAQARLFIGLHSAAASLGNVQPGTLLDCIGLCHDSAQATLRILHHGSTGASTAIDLGAAFPAGNTGAHYELVLTANSTGTAVTYTVTRLDTGAIATGALATNLPGPLTLLAPHLWRCNGTTALAVALDVMEWSMATAQ